MAIAQPTVAEVAAFIRARTKTRGGAEAGTFNPSSQSGTATETRPTAEGVQALIDNFDASFWPIWGDVPDAPPTISDDVDFYRNAITQIAALGVALEVELTYFPEQVATGRSPYQQLLDLFNTRKNDLMSVLGLDDDGDGVPDAGGGAGGYPSYGGFPTTGITIEGAW